MSEHEQDLSIYLQAVYDEFSKKTKFPLLYCKEVATRIEAEKGLRRVSGVFRMDRPTPIGGRFFPHTWNEKSTGERIDLTLAQLQPRMDIPIPQGPLIITRDHPLYDRYIEDTEDKVKTKF